MESQTKIYICAPADVATGGPELLHQLADKLRNMGKNVFMYYYPTHQSKPVHDNYLEYQLKSSTTIEDDVNNLVIVPEVETGILKNLIFIKKMVWWLSIDNYFLRLPKFKGRINRYLLKFFGTQDYFFFDKELKFIEKHLVQSQYAKTFLSKYKIEATDLSDFLHKSFIDENFSNESKKNIVAYNPNKGIIFTKKIIKSAPHIKFIPIKNMTRHQVVSLLKTAKVYIDFGHHPGKDRIPREASYLNCCVITNRKGSAFYQNDLPIKEEFKFNENKSSLKKIVLKIEDCFENYQENNQKFNFHREKIKNEESIFESQVKSIFIN